MAENPYRSWIERVLLTFWGAQPRVLVSRVTPLSGDSVDDNGVGEDERDDDGKSVDDCDGFGGMDANSELIVLQMTTT